MKARKIIGGAIAIVGLVAAVSVADGSSYEMLIRCIGTAMFVGGGLLAKIFDFQTKKQ